jgi:excisionase family DNA binding protein
MDLTTADAAALLGVSDTEVRRLLRERLLDGRRVGNTWIVEAGSVHRRRRLELDRGRAWSPRVAFAALLLLAGRSDADLSDSELSRLRRSVRGGEAMDVVRRSRDLLASEAWRVPASRLDRLTDVAGIFVTAESALQLIDNDVGPFAADAKLVHVGLAAIDLVRVRTELGARAADASVNVIVHVVRTDLADRLVDVRVQRVVTAVLLGAHEDARVRAAAIEFLSGRVATLAARGDA